MVAIIYEFNGRQYVSSTTYIKLEQENKELKEWKENLIRADKKKSDHIDELEEENRKLKEDNRFLTKVCKEYMEKENIVEVAEFTQLYKDDLEKENKKLNERIKELEQCNLNLQTWLDNKEKVNKQLRKDIKWYEKEEDRLKEENKKLKGDSEELKIWLREKLSLALLKEYMGKFEGVDLKND